MEALVVPRKRALDILLLVASILVVAALAAACAGGKPIDVGPPGGGGDDDDDGFDNTFGGGAFPALAQEDCGSTTCHSNANQAGTGGLQLPDAAMTMTTSAAFTEIMAEAVVNTGSPATSLLLTKGEGTAHGGGAQWDSGDATYQAVLGWIQAGAQND